MLRIGDRVYIDGTKLEGTIKEVHPHGVIVHVEVPGGRATSTGASSIKMRISAGSSLSHSYQ
jgi:hypothetical protein